MFLLVIRWQQLQLYLAQLLQDATGLIKFYRWMTSKTSPTSLSETHISEREVKHNNNLLPYVALLKPHKGERMQDMYFRNNVGGKGTVGEGHDSSSPFSFSEMKLKVMCRQSESTREGTVTGEPVPQKSWNPRMVWVARAIQRSSRANPL